MLHEHKHSMIIKSTLIHRKGTYHSQNICTCLPLLSAQVPRNDPRKNIVKLHFMVFASTTKETTDEYDIAIDCPIDFTEF